MEENAKYPPVTAGVLALLLCGLVGEVAAFDYNPRSGALRFDGTIDLKALAAWINRRMGATEGSE